MAVDTLADIARDAKLAAAAARGKKTTTTKAPTTTPAPASQAAGKAKTTGTAGAAVGKSTAAPASQAAGKAKTSSVAAARPKTGKRSDGSPGTAIDVTNVGDAPGAFAWTDYAVRASQATGVPPEFFLALIQVESGGNQNIIGDGGASVGLFQLHERGVGAGYTVEQRQDPELQFRLMTPRIAAGYAEGVAKGYTGRDLAVYVGWYAEKPAAGNEAGYAYAYDIVTSYAATGTVTIGGVPDIPMPSGGTPTQPPAWYGRGGARSTTPLTISEGMTDPTNYNGQGVVEGLYYAGPTTYSGGSSGGGGASPISISPAVGGAVGGALSGVLGVGLADSLTKFIQNLNETRYDTLTAIQTGEAVGLAQTPLGPVAVETSTLYNALWNGGFIALGVIVVAIGALTLVNWRAVGSTVKTATKAAAALAA